jgi:hypothetical protein
MFAATRFAVVAVVLAVVLFTGSVASAISFTGTQAGKAPLSGTISFDADHMYVNARMDGAAVGSNQDYLAIAVDWNNDGLWTEGLDSILVYSFYNSQGATHRVVDTLSYAGGVWDCPWSTSDKRSPGDADWVDGMDISVTTDGDAYVYDAVLPLAPMGVAMGDTIGVLVQGRDQNSAVYGGNGLSINYWPGSTAFNALYDPTQFADVQISTGQAPIPEPLTVLAVSSGLAGLAGYVRRRRV